METKRCYKCGETKDISEFCKDSSRSDGHANICRKCQAAYMKGYHARNREKMNEQSRVYKQDHAEELKVYYKEHNAEYYREHKDEYRDTRSRYHQEHPEVVRASKHRRRTASGGDMSGSVILAVMKASNGICPYCKNPIPHGEGHIDHRVPISRGGTNKRSNLVYVCAECNLRKGTMTDEEFLQ